MQYPMTITEDAITVILNGVPKTAPKSSIYFEQIKQAIRRGTTVGELESLFNMAGVMNQFTEGDFQMEDNNVTYKGEPVPQCIAERLLYLMRERLPYAYVKNFWIRLYQNPSRRAQQELFKFLEHKGMCITPEGMVRAYKAVTADLMDKYSGTFNNHIGADLKMRRQAVCDDADIGCSYGFHVGSLEYVRGFANGYGSEGGDRIIIVEFDPADAVSVPKNCSYQKIRVCHYRVIEEFTGELPTFSGVEYPQDLDPEFWSVEDNENGDNVLSITTDELDAERQEAAEEARAELELEIEARVEAAKAEARAEVQQEMQRRLRNVAQNL